MGNYKDMYITLFNETSKAILALQKAQQLTEEMYMADDSTDDLNVIVPDGTTDRNNEEKQSPQE